MKLLVRNLATATTEEKLLSLFSEYGKVQSCTLVLDKSTGKSKGFGFIEMPKVGEAKIAVHKLNGYKLAGNIIRVKRDEAKKEIAEVSSATEEIEHSKVVNADIKKDVVGLGEVQGNENNKNNIYGTIKK
ncbi:RNA-binding protein [Psychromonas antarctica]|jgi:RNA recognition motif-containing protein|uniref:RNA recognition motif domain-containing protein n=1 Tax=Psychromonas antarctica TaxID=67573 RepID=UPI003083F94A